MKKMIFISFLFVCCFQLSGLAQKSRVGFSLTGGLASQRGTVDGVKEKGLYTPGFGVGFFVDAPIKNSKFSFQPAIQYIQKGKVQQELLGLLQPKISVELRYAEMLFNFMYNTGGSAGGFFIGAGPTLSFNLPSKQVTETSDGTKTVSDVSFGNEVANAYRGIDYGANLVMGYRLKGGFFVSANGTLGLRNLIPANSLATGDIKNTNFGVNFGWLINNK